jgi:hypothetical protein
MALLAAIRSWPVASQQKSRRNAMLACTSLTQRRMERQDVDDFFSTLHPSSAPSLTSTSSSTSSSTKAVAHG